VKHPLPTSFRNGGKNYQSNRFHRYITNSGAGYPRSSLFCSKLRNRRQLPHFVEMAADLTQIDASAPTGMAFKFAEDDERVRSLAGVSASWT
jgi:hypothetical protein